MGVITFRNGEFFEGHFNNDEKNGHGEFKFNDGSTFKGNYKHDVYESGELRLVNQYVYTGSFKKGKRHGKGRVLYPDGETYEGDFIMDKRHGRGVITNAKGIVTYNGEFRDGEKYCPQRDHVDVVDAAGDSFNGQSVNGSWDGMGTCKYANGDVYDGDWYQNMRDGKGRYEFAVDGAVYEGDWRQGMFEGEGKFCYANGDVYTGDWVEGLREGWGKYEYSNGDVYEGWWENNKKECQESKRSKYSFHTGEEYFGNWSNNKMHGHGVCKFANETRYDGMWHEGRRHGRGRFVLTSEVFLEAEFRDDVAGDGWYTIITKDHDSIVTAVEASDSIYDLRLKIFNEFKVLLDNEDIGAHLFKSTRYEFKPLGSSTKIIPSSQKRISKPNLTAPVVLPIPDGPVGKWVFISAKISSRSTRFGSNSNRQQQQPVVQPFLTKIQTFDARSLPRKFLTFLASRFVETRIEMVTTFVS